MIYSEGSSFTLILCFSGETFPNFSKLPCSNISQLQVVPPLPHPGHLAIQITDISDGCRGRRLLVWEWVEVSEVK